MLQFYRCVLSEFKKRKRSIFHVLHLSIPFLFPIALVVFFLSRDVPISLEASYLIFFELIGVGTPVIISIVCGIVADSENEAGYFLNILGRIQSKTVSYISQTAMMILSYCAALFMTVSIYGLALEFIVVVDEVNFTHYYTTWIIFTLSAVFQYSFYQVIGYKFGIGICSLCGFGGLIVAALSMTTIGDKIWGFLPWAWANGFGEYFTIKAMDVNLMTNPMLITGGYSFIIFTIGTIIFSMIWINHWSGRKTND